MAIAKMLTKVKLQHQPKEADYWRTRPYGERLAALEEIRQEYHQWKYRAEPRLQCVYIIAKRK